MIEATNTDFGAGPGPFPGDDDCYSSIRFLSSFQALRKLIEVQR